MANQTPAVALQEELLEKGFRSIELCDDQDDQMITITHYTLSKRDAPPCENPGPCLMYKWFDLAGEEAVEILQKWMNQTSIYPDPRTL